MSNVTKREEPLPIAVSVIGAPGKIPLTFLPLCYQLTITIVGTDLILVDLVEKGMKDAGLPVTVKTGRSLY